MQLRYLKDIELYKSDRVKQSNGTYVETYSKIASYSVLEQELTDEVSFGIYGADLNKITRIKSIRNELEEYLKTKMTNDEDNISKYYIVLDNMQYSIKSVRNNWVDIYLIGKFENLNQSL